MTPYEFPGTIPVINEGRIAQMTADVFRLTESEIYTNSRKRPGQEARCVIMYLTRWKMGKSWQQIGLPFRRDHATAIHCCKTADNLIRYNKHFRARFTAVCRNLGIPENEIQARMT